jgi:hypothetical protein
MHKVPLAHPARGPASACTIAVRCQHAAGSSSFMHPGVAPARAHVCDTGHVYGWTVALPQCMRLRPDPACVRVCWPALAPFSK